MLTRAGTENTSPHPPLLRESAATLITELCGREEISSNALQVGPTSEETRHSVRQLPITQPQAGLQVFDKFLVVGQDNRIYFQLLTLCLLISKEVSFLGGKDNVRDFLFAADLLILPALDENTGTVILEAIVSGTPVLTTENSGYSNYVVESGMGNVVSLPFKQNALNRSLEILLKDIDKEDWLKKSKDFLNQLDVTSLHKKAAKIINRFAVKKEIELNAEN